MKKATLAAIAATALLLASCGDKPDAPEAQATNTATTTQSAAVPAGLMLTALPAGATTKITDLKANAKAGDEVAVSVIVGGRGKPMVESLAVMTVVDASVENACMVEKDHCARPWDYCCADGKELTASMATIRVVDESNKPLALDLTTANIKPGDALVVTGTIAEKNDAGALVINAIGIHKK